MNEFNYDIISQYLAGELVGDELIAFEKQLQTNAALATEVKLYKTIDGELSSLQKNKTETESLTNTLHHLGKAHFKKNVAKVVSINKRWWYAASAVAAAVILFFVLQPSKKIETFNAETLYASYLNKSVDELSFSERGKNNPQLIKAASFYNKKDYISALPLLENEIADNPNETQLILATGVCYMQTNQYAFALRFFDDIANGKSVYKNKAEWYKVLVLLKQNKFAECKIAIQLISKDADDYNNAVELLNKIENK